MKTGSKHDIPSTRSVKQQHLVINSEQSESKKTLDSQKPPSEKVFTTQSGWSELASQMYPIIGSLKKRWSDPWQNVEASLNGNNPGEVGILKKGLQDGFLSSPGNMNTEESQECFAFLIGFEGTTWTQDEPFSALHYRTPGQDPTCQMCKYQKAVQSVAVSQFRVCILWRTRPLRSLKASPSERPC